MGRGSAFLQWIPWGLEWGRDTAGFGHMARSGYMLLAAAARNVDEERGTLVGRPETLAMHMRMCEADAMGALAEMALAQRPDGTPLVELWVKRGDWEQVDPTEIREIDDRKALFKVVVTWVREAEETEAAWRASESKRVKKYKEKTTDKYKKERGVTSKNKKERGVTRNYTEEHIITLEGKGIEGYIYPPISPKGDGAWFDDTFWPAYPRKVAKEAARKAAARLEREGVDLAEVMAGLEAARASDQWTRDGGRYVPHPATWLNGRRWEDEAIAADDGEGSKKPKNAAAYNWPPEGMMYE